MLHYQQRESHGVIVRLLSVLVCPPGAACVQSSDAGECQDDGATHTRPAQPRLLFNYTVPRADTHHVWYVCHRLCIFMSTQRAGSVVCTVLTYLILTNIDFWSHSVSRADASAVPPPQCHFARPPPAPAALCHAHRPRPAGWSPAAWGSSQPSSSQPSPAPTAPTGGCRWVRWEASILLSFHSLLILTWSWMFSMKLCVFSACPSCSSSPGPPHGQPVSTAADVLRLGPHAPLHDPRAQPSVPPGLVPLCPADGLHPPAAGAARLQPQPHGARAAGRSPPPISRPETTSTTAPAKSSDCVSCLGF